jgi:hypothetical protein
MFLFQKNPDLARGPIVPIRSGVQVCQGPTVPQFGLLRLDNQNMAKYDVFDKLDPTNQCYGPQSQLRMSKNPILSSQLLRSL